MRLLRTSVVLLAALAACHESTTGSKARVAAHLDLIAGGSQMGLPSQPLAPIVVRATDASGAPVSGATVVWAASGGTVAASSSQTDANGYASVSWTLDVGLAQSLTATVPGVAPLVVSAQGLPPVIHSCETNTATLCADWTWSNGKYTADWSQGSHANIVATTYSPDQVVFTRDDPSGTSVGMHAVYHGVPASHTVNAGVVTWTQGGSSFSGNWQATW